jgi:exopolysaccharide biosynthesis protein
MKRKFLGARVAAGVLAMLLLLPQTALASEALGWDLLDQTTVIGKDAAVTNSNFWSDTYSTLRTEHYLTYQPSDGTTSFVTYGSGIASRTTLTSMAQSLQSQGYRVLCGINADYFEMNTGVPDGPVVTNGVLRSYSLEASSYYSAIGFRQDGSAFIGQPQLKANATFLGNTLVLAGVNKVRSETGGYYLFTEDFGTKTQNTSAGLDVILTPVTDSSTATQTTGTAGTTTQTTGTTTTTTGTTQSTKLAIGGSVTCKVTGIRQSTDANDIPKGSFVLSVNYKSDAWLVSQLQALALGDTVVLDVSCDDARWSQATEAVGGLFRLITDGAVNSDLDSATASSAQSQEPRTAVGVKADGSVVFYTIDGREYGYSVGATVKQVAKRLLELGCVDAISFDGGGSTTFEATMPDGTTTTLMNSPSDGSERKVSNALFLVSKLSATGTLGSVYVKSDQQLLLPGATAQMTASGVDSAYYPMSTGGVTWTADKGSIDSAGTYTAGTTAGAAVISAGCKDASGTNITGSTTVQVVTSPTAINVTNEQTGNSVTALALTPGEQVSLKAAAVWKLMPVAGGDSCFTFTADSAVGTIDPQGNFTASSTDGTGNLTVTAGDKTVTIPVTVKKPSPFVDTEDNWAEKYINQLYDLGVTTGVTTDQGLCFYPASNITRGEFFLMVARYMGLDVTQYASQTLPFADASSIPDWAVNGVKAMYAKGILTGSKEGSKLYAKADSTITRAEAMTILGRTLGTSATCNLSAYTDAADIPQWALSYVQTLVAKGVVNGDNAGRLNPTANLTRAEVSKILVTMKDLTSTASN